VKFLIDECLSPALAHLARERGYSESTHVVWLGREGQADWTLARLAIDQDWTFVTKNAYDFRGPAGMPGDSGQYQDVELHAGLVCLNGDPLDRATQLVLFGAVLDALAEDGDPVNQVLEATMLDFGGIKIQRYALPAE